MLKLRLLHITKCYLYNLINLINAAKTPIIRHIKVRAVATPYDPSYHEYYDKLIAKRKIINSSKTAASWWLCWWKCFTSKEKKFGLPMQLYKGLSRVQ
jgi:hypothetical protein